MRVIESSFTQNRHWVSGGFRYALKLVVDLEQGGGEAGICLAKLLDTLELSSLMKRTPPEKLVNLCGNIERVELPEKSEDVLLVVKGTRGGLEAETSQLADEDVDEQVGVFEYRVLTCFSEVNPREITHLARYEFLLNGKPQTFPISLEDLTGAQGKGRYEISAFQLGVQWFKPRFIGYWLGMGPDLSKNIRFSLDKSRCEVELSQILKGRCSQKPSYFSSVTDVVSDLLEANNPGHQVELWKLFGKPSSWEPV